MKKIGYIVLFFNLWSSLAFAQVDTSASSENSAAIKIIRSDSAEILQVNGQQITKLKGNVKLYQDSVFMACDSAIVVDRTQLFAYDSVSIQQGDSLVAYAEYLEYNGETRKAYLEKDVVLISGEQQLFTQRLDYDLNTKVASYYFGATLVNDSTQLTSRRGYYYVDQEEAFFKDSVQVNDPKFYLKADTLNFNTGTKTVYFLGPTLITADTSDIYCEDGFYDTENGLAVFSQNAQYQKGDRQAVADEIRFEDARRLYVLAGNAQVRDSARYAEADTIRYFEGTDESYLEGNAIFRDQDRNIQNANTIYYNGQNDTYRADGRPTFSDQDQILTADIFDFDESTGIGLAVGTVLWQDTSAKIAINTDSARYLQEEDYLKAMGGPMGRPELITVLQDDSLFLAADTLVSYRPDTSGLDTSRILTASYDVRIFKSDFQGKCDSMVYYETDSLFRLFRNPILWANDSTQFKADSIAIQMANDEIDRVILVGNAIIIDQETEELYNQIKGKRITAYFKDGELDRLRVIGNAETIYYAKDDQNQFIGVDQSICSELAVLFEDGELQRLKFYKEPNSTLFPMNKVDHASLRLDGFEWLIQQKPKQRSDLFVKN